MRRLTWEGSSSYFAEFLMDHLGEWYLCQGPGNAESKRAAVAQWLPDWCKLETRRSSLGLEMRAIDAKSEAAA